MIQTIMANTGWLQDQRDLDAPWRFGLYYFTNLT